MEAIYSHVDIIEGDSYFLSMKSMFNDQSRKIFWVTPCTLACFYAEIDLLLMMRSLLRVEKVLGQ